eukprot:TRINITY_DN9226_c0_g1_i1.p1 TRINITY_DN9226_c0_g1~~TRINITY_DN9226_c0_g1_i1.p1  ORF type:complete len:136 (+),score=1.79 TRINITY_DN9226_c0_g1_i1:112-519(+)
MLHPSLSPFILFPLFDHQQSLSSEALIGWVLSLYQKIGIPPRSSQCAANRIMIATYIIVDFLSLFSFLLFKLKLSGCIWYSFEVQVACHLLRVGLEVSSLFCFSLRHERTDEGFRALPSLPFRPPRVYLITICGV